jgi:hypothetical protein
MNVGALWITTFHKGYDVAVDVAHVKVDAAATW